MWGGVSYSVKRLLEVINFETGKAAYIDNCPVGLRVEGLLAWALSAGTPTENSRAGFVCVAPLLSPDASDITWLRVE